MCQSVIIGSLTLRKMFSLDFGVKCNFSKIRIEQVMLNFLAKNQKNKIRRFELQSRERSPKSQREIAICNFRYITRTRVELSYSWQETENNQE